MGAWTVFPLFLVKRSDEKPLIHQSYYSFIYLLLFFKPTLYPAHSTDSLFLFLEKTRTKKTIAKKKGFKDQTFPSFLLSKL